MEAVRCGEECEYDVQDSCWDVCGDETCCQMMDDVLDEFKEKASVSTKMLTAYSFKPRFHISSSMSSVSAGVGWLVSSSASAKSLSLMSSSAAFRA